MQKVSALLTLSIVSRQSLWQCKQWPFTSSHVTASQPIPGSTCTTIQWRPLVQLSTGLPTQRRRPHGWTLCRQVPTVILISPWTSSFFCETMGALHQNKAILTGIDLPQASIIVHGIWQHLLKKRLRIVGHFGSLQTASRKSVLSQA